MEKKEGMWGYVDFWERRRLVRMGMTGGMEVGRGSAGLVCDLIRKFDSMMAEDGMTWLWPYRALNYE